MVKRVGLIGLPVAHSVSPAFQQVAFDYCGIDVRYEFWETSSEDLQERVAELRSNEVLGAQVTVPHKELVARLVDDSEGDVALLGACNVVVNRGGKLMAHNTDVLGFLRGLKEDAGFDPKRKRALVLGAGGAARAIVLALAREGIGSLVISNRTPRRADSLATLALGSVRSVRVIGCDEGSLREASAQADLIVNCTTLGMSGGEGEGLTPLRASSIPARALVYDIVYNPTDTPLLREARKAGAQIQGGLPMLVYVGAAAFELWLDKEAPISIMMAAARRALADRLRQSD